MNMCSLIILAAKNIILYSFRLLLLGVVPFRVVQLGSSLG